MGKKGNVNAVFRRRLNVRFGVISTAYEQGEA